MSQSKLYRLYIDESGNHNYSKSDGIDQRYLSLTGIIIDSADYETKLQPRILNLKKIFTRDLDDLPVLHHEDIMAKRGHFSLLRDPTIQKEFDQQLLGIIAMVPYVICCVVIDKKLHLEKYQQSAAHPYHYCLNVMLEKYTHFLEIRGRGDVCAESRGKVEDFALKKVYQDFYNFGTYFKRATFIQSVLTSKEIKIQSKQKAIPGLELADLLALTTKLDVLNSYGVISDLSDNFNKKIIRKIQDKYCRGNNSGRVKGYGKKLL